MDAIRRRIKGDRQTPERDSAPPSDVERYLEHAMAAAREDGRKEQAEQTVAWLRHPSTVERIAEILYEARTGRRWLSAEEIDRIAYIANARAVVGFLMFERPQ